MTKDQESTGWVSTIWTIVVAVLIVVLLRMFVFTPVIISGHSMDPTLHNKERVIALKYKKIQRFDIVTLKAPDAEDEEYVKRIIGLPGDEISMKNDQLYINGKKYSEPYLDDYKKRLKNGTLAKVYSPEMRSAAENAKNFTQDFTLKQLTNGETVKVPKGTYFVLGDNRLISKDSRYIGFIPKSSILGEVVFAYYPFKYFGFVH